MQHFAGVINDTLLFQNVFRRISRGYSRWGYVGRDNDDRFWPGYGDIEFHRRFMRRVPNLELVMGYCFDEDHSFHSNEPKQPIYNSDDIRPYFALMHIGQTPHGADDRGKGVTDSQWLADQVAPLSFLRAVSLLQEVNEGKEHAVVFTNYYDIAILFHEIPIWARQIRSNRMFMWTTEELSETVRLQEEIISTVDNIRITRPEPVRFPPITVVPRRTGTTTGTTTGIPIGNSGHYQILRDRMDVEMDGRAYRDSDGPPIQYRWYTSPDMRARYITEEEHLDARAEQHTDETIIEAVEEAVEGTEENTAGEGEDVEIRDITDAADAFNTMVTDAQIPRLGGGLPAPPEGIEAPPPPPRRNNDNDQVSQLDTES